MAPVLVAVTRFVSPTGLVTCRFMVHRACRTLLLVGNAPSLEALMLVAYSHLRWSSVWQRPQHLLTRFSRTMPVLVVEEPVVSTRGDDLRVLADGKVTIVTPMLAGERGAQGFGVSANESIGRLIAPLVSVESEL